MSCGPLVDACCHGVWGVPSLSRFVEAPPSPLEPGGRCASGRSSVELSLSLAPERQELDMRGCNRIPAEAWEQLSDGVWPALQTHKICIPERLYRRA